MSSARIELDSERIATIWLDAPGKRVNTLSRQMWADLAGAIDQIEREKPRGVIIASAKPGTFVLGADLFEIRDMNDDEFDRYILTGQEILNRLEGLSITTVAAIGGDALGGGLELALACKVRVCHDVATLRIGLPETNLGLVPGWGGTVRLTQLIGPRHALTMIVAGHHIDPAIAATFGIVDQTVPADWLLECARMRATDPPPVREKMIDGPFEMGQLRQSILQHPSLQTLSQLRLLDVVQIAIEQGAAKGLEAERRAIVELRRSPESQKLLGEFFARKSAKSAKP